MPSKQQPPSTQPSRSTPSVLPASLLSASSSAAAATSVDTQLDPCASEGEEVARVCQLNKAILLYQQGSYKEAVELLEPAFAELEVLHDGHALHVCTLLMDCLLACHQPQRAASVLLALEQAFAHAHRPPDAPPPHHQALGAADPCAPPLLSVRMGAEPPLLPVRMSADPPLLPASLQRDADPHPLPVRQGAEQAAPLYEIEQPLPHARGVAADAQMSLREGNVAKAGHREPLSLSAHSQTSGSAAAVRGSASSTAVGSSSSSSSSVSSARPAPGALGSCSSTNTGPNAAVPPQLQSGCSDQSASGCDLEGVSSGHAQAGRGGLMQQQQQQQQQQQLQQQQWQSCMVALPPVTRWDSDAMGQACQVLQQCGHVVFAIQWNACYGCRGGKLCDTHPQPAQLLAIPILRCF
ncbi:hypothetical protein DUNSADRAFT_7587 [Dunaliella salina]|uniref:CCR4-NOT transcription complex subunit 10 n=1 Tax=Dunaliella salina TaxID=3046 RepID=A0ABQ7GL24_DUNSA|nr:hypothetical protein DUNSADRAFT_7587 [Dunaliella salina]|eukprot:KAF5835307.1 hypothetical protein DUNSADRAFT_7587 [Dunaliella salina]